MRIVFRADASTAIGTGHVMRCLTLADELAGRGAECLFLCREHPGNLLETIRSRGHAAIGLPMGSAEDTGEPLPAHTGWLGAGWREDAAQTIAALGGERSDWLVVDHYALDARWECAVRSACAHLMAIDDLADRDHDCDLLLDQNLVDGARRRYLPLTPAGCTRFIGPEYAMVQPQYRELRASARVRRGPVRNVLIFFGGVDAHNLSSLALEALLELDRPEVLAHALVSPANPNAARLHELAAEHPDRVRLHPPQPSLAPLMLMADLALGACGTASWERLCLGLPALAVTIADNQREIAAELDRLGLVRLLGHAGEVDREALAAALGETLAAGLDPAWSARCFAAVDGFGAPRVAAALLAGEARELRAREAGLGDLWLFFDWANDPAARANAFRREPIPPVEHEAWFTSSLTARERCRLFVIEGGEGGCHGPLGQVRLDLRSEGGWRISYALSPLYRGRGLGCKLLAAGLIAFWREFPLARVYGEVKPENVASRRVFASLGFLEERGGADGSLLYTSGPRALPQ